MAPRPKLIMQGVGLITGTDAVVDFLDKKGVQVPIGMTLDEILDFALWEERGIEYRLHVQMGDLYQYNPRTHIIRDGKLNNTKLKGWS